MNQEQTATLKRGNGAAENVPPMDAASTASGAGAPRVISDPNEVATIVLMQIDAVNDRQHDLTTAIKGLTDLTKQLMRSYGDLTATVRAQQAKLKEMGEKLAKTGS